METITDTEIEIVRNKLSKSNQQDLDNSQLGGNVDNLHNLIESFNDKEKEISSFMVCSECGRFGSYINTHKRCSYCENDDDDHTGDCITNSGGAWCDCK